MHQTNKGDSRHSGHGRLKFAKEKNSLYYRLIFFLGVHCSRNITKVGIYIDIVAVHSDVYYFSVCKEALFFSKLDALVKHGSCTTYTRMIFVHEVIVTINYG